MELADLLADPNAHFLCVSDNGAEIVETPPQLQEWEEQALVPASPLDAFTTDSQGGAVSAFRTAIVHGQATEIAVLNSSGETCRINAFDRRETLNCLVLVLSPTTEEHRVTAAFVNKRCRPAPTWAQLGLNGGSIVQVIPLRHMAPRPLAH